MTFFEISQSLAPFTLLCLFFFFYRMKRLENALIALSKRTQQQNVALAKAIEQLQQAKADKPDTDTGTSPAHEETDRKEQAI